VGLGMAAALAIRRLSPALALVVAWATVAIQLSASLNPDVSNLAILPVLYATARYGERRTRWAGLASAGIGALIASLYLFFKQGYDSTDFFGLSVPDGGLIRLVWVFAASVIVSGAVFGISWVCGLLVRTWTNARETRRQKLDAENAVVVEQERNRIARDMHDVVAHSLAVVIAQADGARYARAHDPEAVDEALVAISTTARDALGDVRLLLGQLRHSQGQGPQPVLADLDRLLDQLRASGLTIDYEQHGDARPLGTAHELSIYRIIQEAITNALRHGDRAAPVALRFDWLADRVDLTITNGIDVPTTTAELHIGHGLAGMTERAALVGGSLRAAPDGSRFVVSATLPTAVVA